MTAVQREPLIVEFAERWNGEWMGPSRFTLRSDGLLWPLTPGDRSLATELSVPGTLFASLTDFHVHLGLVVIEKLGAGGLTAVHDLGWRPADAKRWLLESERANGAPVLDISVVGGLLSCRDGYPAHSGWAPDGATIELDEPSGAEAAVAAQHALGASAIKITLNSDAGPVPSEALLEAIATAAHERGMPVIAHAQGAGQPERAWAAGVDTLAHAPFTKALGTETLAAMAAPGPSGSVMTWISTLDKHGWGNPTREFEIALDNVRRFHAAGGRILYGTDLGDGPLPEGINERELLALARAGLDREALLTSIAGAPAPDAPIGPRFAWAPGLPPAGAEATASWLTTARSTTATHLKESLT